MLHFDSGTDSEKTCNSWRMILFFHTVCLYPFDKIFTFVLLDLLLPGYFSHPCLYLLLVIISIPKFLFVTWSCSCLELLFCFEVSPHFDFSFWSLLLVGSFLSQPHLELLCVIDKMNFLLCIVLLCLQCSFWSECL